MNPVVHFELPAEDQKRMSTFYTKVFGWQTQMMGPEMGNYVVVTTTEGDKNGRPIKPGAINGGLYKKDKAQGAEFPSVVIAVDDLNEHMKKVTKAGGKIKGKPTQIPNVGLFVSFIDTEGNRISMLQPDMKGHM